VATVQTAQNTEVDCKTERHSYDFNAKVHKKTIGCG
jgi:hypothetical protein